MPLATHLRALARDCASIAAATVKVFIARKIFSYPHKLGRPITPSYQGDQKSSVHTQNDSARSAVLLLVRGMIGYGTPDAHLHFSRDRIASAANVRS